MRIPIAITVLIVAAAGATAWHCQLRLADLRNDHQKLLALAAERSIAFDPSHPERPAHVTKRPRPDRVAEAKQTAAGLISYLEDLRLMKQEKWDAAIRQRMMAQMDEAMALDGEQLKILITELRHGWITEDAERGNLLHFALNRLASDYPQDVLRIISDSPEMQELIRQHTNSLTDNIVFTAVRNWAITDLEAAATWVREFGNDVETDQLTPTKAALILSAAEHDPVKCIGFISEFQADAKRIADVFVSQVESPRQRLAFLTVLRELRARHADDADTGPSLDWGIRRLAIGERNKEKPGFDFTSRWIDTATLSPKEIDIITMDLPGYVSPDETGRWIEWLGTKLPPDIASDRVSDLVTNWVEKDYKSAGDWLTSATDGPMKHTAARAYAEAIFPHDRESAIQWALSVPAGDDRDRTLKRLYDIWPKEDAEGAAAFARGHGIE